MLFQFITAWAVLTLSCWAAATLLPGVSIPSPKDSIVIAATLGAINAAIGYLVVMLFGADSATVTAIVIFATRSVITALLFTALAERLKSRITFQSQISALGCAVLMSGLGTGLQYLLG